MFGAAARSARGRGRNIFYGWWIVLGGGVSQAYTSGAYWQGFGAFFDLILEHFGWSRSVTSAAVSIQRTESGAIAPFVGYFIDKFGPRQVMLFGIVILGVGFILLSRVQNLWQFYLAFLIITLGLSFGTFMVVTTCIANWFVEKRTRALAIAMTGTGIGGMLVPLLIVVINTTGWRTALLIVGLGFFATGIPAALIMRRRPEDYGLLPDGRQPDDDHTQSAAGGVDRPPRAPSAAQRQDEHEYSVREAVLTRSFWQLAVAVGTGQLAMSASIHHIPAMTSFGVSLGTAGLIMMGSAIASIAGRLTSGFIGDAVDKRYVIATSFGCQIAGMLFLAYGQSIPMLMGFRVFWGLGWGATSPVRFALIADYFGRRNFGSILGLLSTVTTIFGIGGPVFVGWMADVRGNYRDPFIIMAVSLVISVPLILTLRGPTRRGEGSGAGPRD